MLTIGDFQKAIADTIASYPELAPYYDAGDPRILQAQLAMATMLSMLSAQLEVAQVEAFVKARESTVKADAANRGIIKKAVPAKASITVNNKSTVSITVDASRNVLDSDGRIWRVVAPATIAAGGTGSIEATQEAKTVVTHTVKNSVPFYAIEVPETEDTYLSAIAVKDSADDYSYRERFTNTLPDEKIFHVETNDYDKTFVRFGVDGVVGVQPVDGTVITLTISYSFGDVRPKTNSPFSFEYLANPDESKVTLSMGSLLKPGQNPPSIAYLRDISRYPSVYDHAAVYLGEFDFLVRRNYTTLKFLSVWNETMEEDARGADVANINTLFVACLSDLGTETTLTETTTPVVPTVITTLTATQTAIKQTILQADNSYRVKFYTPVRYVIALAINATVPSSYVASEVSNQIKTALLAEYGETSESSRHGRNSPLYQQIYALLKQKVPALQNENSDFTLTITNTPPLDRPEVWRYVTDASITAIISLNNSIPAYWGG
jgi:hypothetical protein